jgi:hypothetical protein
VPELEVVSADLALAPPYPDQGIKMPEDSGTGTDSHEHLYKVGEDRHEEDGVGGEVLELKAELLQEQEEEGGDQRYQPAHSVRVEKDKLPCGKVAEGDFSGPNPPGVLWRGPSQKAAHQVQLALALEAAWKRERRHGDGRCDCGGWIAREQEGDEMPSTRKQNANVRAETKGRGGVWKRQERKGCRSLRCLLLCKAVHPFELRGDREEAKGSPAPGPLLSHSMTGGPGPAS